MTPTVVITTRGDVDLTPILDSLPDWPVVVWNNAERQDMKVYGYFSALEEVQTDYVYTQADDTIVPAVELLEAWVEDRHGDRILVNVREGDTPWISFGGIFHRHLPRTAFSRYLNRHPWDDDVLLWPEVIFTTLTPWERVWVGKEDLPHHRNPNRMEWQPNHYVDQQRVRDRCLALL